MPLPLIYLGVVLIWATTPLAIQWSTISFSPLASLTMRMAISLILVAAYAATQGGVRLNWRKNGALYFAASLGIFPTMVLVYVAAQYIPSGLMSVLFGLSPFMVALCSWVWLRVVPVDGMQFISLFISVAGLSVICIDQAGMGSGALVGIGLALCASFLFALSSLLVKQFGANAGAIEQLFGALVVAVPTLVLVSVAMGEIRFQVPTLKSLAALLYLGIVGSFLGFLAYFRLVQKLDVMLVALIPLITPMLAIWLGNSLNGEQLTQRLLMGSVGILLGLALFNHKVFSPRKFKPPHRSR